MTASENIDHLIAGLADWRGKTLASVRKSVLQADPEIVEDWKWKGSPVWSRDGMIAVANAHKAKVKLTFAHGASLADPDKLFNASLEGNMRRAIDFLQGDRVDERGLKNLVRAAIFFNQAKSKTGIRPKSNRIERRKVGKGRGQTDHLLSGGNPQIPMGDGDAPVQDYIAAMPGWKKDLGRRIDALIARNVPNVRRAVKWNSPLYGIEGQGWFLGIHVFARYVKLTFFKGIALQPLPPGGTERSQEARWIDIHEVDELDEALITEWVKQAAALPGFLAPPS